MVIFSPLIIFIIPCVYKALYSYLHDIRWMLRMLACRWRAATDFDGQDFLCVLWRDRSRAAGDSHFPPFAVQFTGVEMSLLFTNCLLWNAPLFSKDLLSKVWLKNGC